MCAKRELVAHLPSPAMLRRLMRVLSLYTFVCACVCPSLSPASPPSMHLQHLWKCRKRAGSFLIAVQLCMQAALDQDDMMHAHLLMNISSAMLYSSFAWLRSDDILIFKSNTRYPVTRQQTAEYSEVPRLSIIVANCRCTHM